MNLTPIKTHTELQKHSSVFWKSKAANFATSFIMAMPYKKVCELLSTGELFSRNHEIKDGAPRPDKMPIKRDRDSYRTNNSDSYKQPVKKSVSDDLEPWIIGIDD